MTRENKFRTTSHQFFGNTLSPLSAFVCCLQHSWDELRGAGNANRREVIISLSLVSSFSSMANKVSPHSILNSMNVSDDDGN